MSYAVSPKGFHWIDNEPGAPGWVEVEFEYDPVFTFHEAGDMTDSYVRKVIYSRRELAFEVHGPVPPWTRFDNWQGRLPYLWSDIYIHPDIELNEAAAKRAASYLWPCECGCMWETA